MNARFLVTGTLAGAVALFAWQTVSNAALPWHMATMTEIPNSRAAVEAIRQHAPTNGVWWAKEGVMVVSAVTPDLADKTTTAAMGPMMATQVAIDLVAALAVALVLLQLPAAPALRTGLQVGGVTFAAAVIAHLSDWNWYGFAASYEIVNTIDLTINGLVAGLTLGALRNRMSRGTPDATAIPVELPGVRAAGGLPPLGTRPVARKI